MFRNLVMIRARQFYGSNCQACRVAGLFPSVQWTRAINLHHFLLSWRHDREGLLSASAGLWVRCRNLVSSVKLRRCLSTAGRGVRFCSGDVFDQRSRELGGRNGNKDRDDDNRHGREMDLCERLDAG